MCEANAIEWMSHFHFTQLLHYHTFASLSLLLYLESVLCCSMKLLVVAASISLRPLSHPKQMSMYALKRQLFPLNVAACSLIMSVRSPLVSIFMLSS